VTVGILSDCVRILQVSAADKKRRHILSYDVGDTYRWVKKWTKTGVYYIKDIKVKALMSLYVMKEHATTVNVSLALNAFDSSNHKNHYHFLRIEIIDYYQRDVTRRADLKKTPYIILAGDKQ
jgi:hypothetical protein